MAKLHAVLQFCRRVGTPTIVAADWNMEPKQLAEITWQLRGEAGPRQRSGARLGAALAMGGGEFELDANACSVMILASDQA